MSYNISDKLSMKQLLIFAFPTICMFIFAAFYTIVDGIFVSRFVSPDALAGLNMAFPPIIILTALAIMFGTGGSAFVGQRLGMKRKQLANKAFTLITLTVLVLSIFYSILILLYVDEICYFLGADEILFPYARDYLFTMMLFGPFYGMQWYFQCFLVTASQPRLGFLLSFLGGCLNIIFDYIFIVVLDMGIKGAAYATIIGALVMCIGACIYFLKENRELQFTKPRFRPIILGRSMFNGSSEMVTELSHVCTTFLYNIIMMHYLGAMGVAAIAATLYADFLIASTIIGFSIGVSPVISYHYGAKNIDYLKATVKKSFYFIIVISLVVFLVSFFGAKYIALIFFGANTEVYFIAEKGLQIFSFAFLFKGINIFASALFTALGNGFVSGFLSFCRTFLFLITNILLFSYFFGAYGSWYAISASECMAFFVFVYFTKSLREKYKIL